MISEYVHLPLEEPVDFISASYWVSGEEVIPFKDEEFLGIVRETGCVTCCDGSCSTGFRSVLVPGFVKKLKYRTNTDGLFVSEVEPIEDEDVMDEIKKIVLEKYPLTQVEFFCP